MNKSVHSLWPYVAAALGIALLSLMDAFMKGAALAAGAYSASLLRSLFGTAMAAPIWLAGRPKWPRGRVLKLHIERGFVSAAMALSWFYALTILPIAEAIALGFVAPLIALYFAHWLLKEEISKNAIIASLLGLLGTVIIVAGRLGQSELTTELALGLGALFFSATLYAYNFVVIRKQAQAASPIEVATFHSGIGGLVQLMAAPWLFILPEFAVMGDIAISAVLTVSGAVVIAWAYARAQAQALVPLEYSGFLWACLFGWWFFGESVTLATLAGALLIALGSWIARPKSTKNNQDTTATQI